MQTLIWIWLQIEDRIDLFGIEFLIDILPKIFASVEMPLTINAIFDAEKKITGIFDSSADRYKLGNEILIESMIISESIDTKNRLAAWIKRLNNGAILRSLEKRTGISKEVIEALRRYYPKAKSLDKFDVS